MSKNKFDDSYYKCIRFILRNVTCNFDSINKNGEWLKEVFF